MKTQRARDEQAITIAVGLGVLLGVLAAGGLVIAAVGAFAGFSEAFDAGLPWLIALGCTCCALYLLRHRT